MVAIARPGRVGVGMGTAEGGDVWFGLGNATGRVESSALVDLPVVG